MNTFGCEKLKEYLSSFSLIQECDIVKNGAIRFATPFTYPNGSYIDLFLQPKNDLLKSYILSDYGQTYYYLQDSGFNIWGTKKRSQFVTDICESLGVRYKQGMFEIEFGEDNLPQISNFIVRLTQTCIRVTD
jgi:hypothetical protein